MSRRKGRNPEKKSLKEKRNRGSKSESIFARSLTAELAKIMVERRGRIDPYLIRKTAVSLAQN